MPLSPIWMRRSLVGGWLVCVGWGSVQACGPNSSNGGAVCKTVDGGEGGIACVSGSSGGSGAGGSTTGGGASSTGSSTGLTGGSAGSTGSTSSSSGSPATCNALTQSGLTPKNPALGSSAVLTGTGFDCLKQIVLEGGNSYVPLSASQYTVIDDHTIHVTLPTIATKQVPPCPMELVLQSTDVTQPTLYVTFNSC